MIAENNVNEIRLLGSLGPKDARRKDSGVVDMWVGTRRLPKGGGKEMIDWHNVQYFHCPDDKLLQLLAGTPVYVEGSVTYYEDRKKKTRLAEISTSKVIILGISRTYSRREDEPPPSTPFDEKDDDDF